VEVEEGQQCHVVYCMRYSGEKKEQWAVKVYRCDFLLLRENCKLQRPSHRRARRNCFRPIAPQFFACYARCYAYPRWSKLTT
jgi:hypothetical protein